MQKILRALIDNDEKTKLLLFKNTIQNVLHTTIFGNLDQVKSFGLLEDRLLLLKKICLIDNSNNLILPFPDIQSLDFIWSYVLPIAQKIKQKPNTIFGIAGPPGSGKSTLANAILKCISVSTPSAKALAISLDDFYFSKLERKKIGIRWRGQPGSHNVEQAISFLDSIKSKKDKVVVPHFDHASDDCNPSETLSGPIDLLIFEGWFVGMYDHGYDKIASYIDYLIYLDCSEGFSKTRRFGKEDERRMQSENQKGMSLNDMNHFWDEVLYPGISKWVLPIKSHANLIINVELPI